MCECPLLHGHLRLGLNGSRPVSKPKLAGRYDNRLDCSHRLSRAFAEASGRG